MGTALSSETASPSTDQAFGLLSHRVRIDILRAMREATDPLDPEAIPFSVIRDRVDLEDPGQLNYHLNKLREHFSDGYELRESGRRILRVLISGTAIANQSIRPVEIDAKCVFCGAQIRLAYEDGWRYLECKECEAQCVDSYPNGVLSMHELPLRVRFPGLPRRSMRRT